MGKVAIVRDTGAVTYVWWSVTSTNPHNSLADRSFEAFLYFLFTDEINFAPLSSDPRHELPAQARVGDWSAGKPLSPSAKSIYRLADKVTVLPFVRLLSLSRVSVRHSDPQRTSYGAYS
jgi:hypothetical protein